MARKLDARPRTPLWVQVTLIHAGVTSLVACGPKRGMAGDNGHGPPPTCGPCCHSPSGQECMQMQQPEPPPPTPDATPASDAPPK